MTDHDLLDLTALPKIIRCTATNKRSKRRVIRVCHSRLAASFVRSFVRSFVCVHACVRACCVCSKRGAAGTTKGHVCYTTTEHNHSEARRRQKQLPLSRAPACVCVCVWGEEMRPCMCTFVQQSRLALSLSLARSQWGRKRGGW